ncbi:MAG: hypothetical protein Q4F83_13815 [Eubacteriales bacterium]|nr:hypothetical protein [Eubacteriales bacterium]
MRKLQSMAGWIAAALMISMTGAAVNAEDVTETVTEAAQGSSQVASADEMTTPEDIVEDWMVPIYGEELNDGTYDVEVLSSSSMFRIEKCELTVSEGKMAAVMTMGGTGYLKVFMGTGEEAVKASEDEYIPFAETTDGKHTFEVPVEALDMGINCAAFSKNKEKWYDRILVFASTSLPMEAFKEVKMTTVADLNLEDGAYLADASLSGGSGRTEIESPAEITVENGEITARIVFSSPNYDYMLVNGEKYEPVNTEGNSAFLIPVPGFDYNMPVVADTIAMSTPHEIDYTILLDSASVKKAE